jgi:hypothetical protein
MKNQTLRSPLAHDPVDLMLTRGTFSRAGKSKVVAQNDFEVMSRRSLYEQCAMQNIEANRSVNISAKAKSAIGHAFKSA